MNRQKQDFENSIVFKTSRSGGKGGQNVNKVSTKAELNLDLNAQQIFSQEEKNRLLIVLKNRISKEGILQVVCQEERSQLLNKEKAMEKLVSLVNSALQIQKKRKITRRSKSAIEERLKEKMANSRKKINRKRDFDY